MWCTAGGSVYAEKWTEISTNRIVIVLWGGAHPVDKVVVSKPLDAANLIILGRAAVVKRM